MGWDAITNGELIRLAEADFDVFVTSDQNIRYQQNDQAYESLVENKSHETPLRGPHLCSNYIFATLCR